MNSLTSAFEAYKKRPSSFVYPGFLQWIFEFSTIMLFMGLLFLINGSILQFQQNNVIIATTLLFGLLIILIFKGYEASLYNGFLKGLNNDRERLDEYFSYSIKKIPVFTLISIVKLFLFLILLMPLGALYYYKPDVFSSQLFLVVISFIYLFIYWVLSYLFKLSKIIVVYKNVKFTKTFSAIKEGFLISLKKFFVVFPIFFIETLVFLIGLIPVLNIISQFFLYPIVISAYMLSYKNFEDLFPSKSKKIKKKPTTHKFKKKKK